MEDFGRLTTAIIAVIVVIVGGIVTISDSSSLSFDEYIQSVAIGVGLLGIGYGIDSRSKP